MIYVGLSTANCTPVWCRAVVILLGLLMYVPALSCTSLHRQRGATATTATTVVVAPHASRTHVSRHHQQHQQRQHQPRGQRNQAKVDTTTHSSIPLRGGSGRSDGACFAASAWSGARHVPRIRHGVRDRAFSMKVKGGATQQRRRGGGGPSSGAATAVRRNGSKTKKAQYIQIEDISSDSWRLVEAAEILSRGGVGVIPTDTCYTFACDIHSRKGVERILQIKNQQGRHKALTLLCKDISTMNTYARGIDKALFKTMKAVLPGAYTFILPSTNEVPRMLLEHKHHKRTWKRKEIGIRLPDAPILLDLMQQLDGPLLCGSVPCGSAHPEEDEKNYFETHDDDEDDEGDGGRDGWNEDALVSGDPAAIERTWGHAVDFVIDAGVLEVEGFSTVVDAIGVEPVILREGLGDPFPIVG